MIFITAAPGFESHLEREMLQYSLAIQSSGTGWRSLTAPTDIPLPDPARFCFSHATLPDATTISGETVNTLAAAITDYFCALIKTERIELPWPLCVWTANTETPSSRVRTLADVLSAMIKKRMSRVARLAQVADVPAPGSQQGLFVCFTTPGTACVSRPCFGGGQRRMKDDPQAPSRSYLKVEEAYRIMGCHPMPGERVADLGAAPGGWSYSAALRGAQVIAVDNGPLKGGAKDNPNIIHREEDAFSFGEKSGETYDWLFCDMVEDPYRILNLVREWIGNGWCRKFVVNFKFGRTDPIRLLDVIRDERKGLAGMCSGLRARHLYHDREEFTVMGDKS